MASKRICLTCGKQYSYCGSCYADRFKPSWYSSFCSDECHEIDKIISYNTAKMISDLEAKNQLLKLDLSKTVLKNKLVKDRIEELLKVEDVIENVVEEKDIEEDIKTADEEIKIEENKSVKNDTDTNNIQKKQYYNKKKNNK